MESTILTASKIALLSSQTDHSSAADSCHVNSSPSLFLSMDPAEASNRWSPHPHMWAKNNSHKAQPLTSFQCYQTEVRGFPALWQQYHADQETLFSIRLSTTQGHNGSSTAPRIKLAFSESSKLQPCKNRPTNTFGNLPITHNRSIFLIKQKKLAK